MGKNALIELVREKRNLWDQSLKTYHNRDLKASAWNEIGEALKIEAHDAKRAWEYLRDSYRRKLATLRKKKNWPHGGELQETWPYFTAMDFLRETLSARKSSGKSRDPIDSTYEHQENYNQDDGIQDNDTEGIDSQDEDSQSESRLFVDEPAKYSVAERAYNESNTSASCSNKHQLTNRRSTKRKSTIEKLLETEGKKLEILSNSFSNKEPRRENDGDRQFLLSLWEPMQELSCLEKMRVKSEIMNILTRAIEKKSVPTSSASVENYFDSTTMR